MCILEILEMYQRRKVGPPASDNEDNVVSSTLDKLHEMETDCTLKLGDVKKAKNERD
jgi:hypothetical protein